VVGSALLPGERLRWYHVAGAIAGLAGTILIVGRNGFHFEGAYAIGYCAAFLCAFTWSGYSLLTRRFDAVSTDVVTGFCLATSVLSLACHVGLETTIWPETILQWIAVVGLGLFPVGAAFYAWDYGVKNGDIQILGAASYAAPLLSTLILTLFGFAEPSWGIAGACLLVTGGAVLAAHRMILRRPSEPQAAIAE
jgi:drug/metabolite transporter (DMT)-like permease